MYRQLWHTFRQLRPAIVHTRNLAALEAQLPAWAARVPVRVHGEHGRDIEDLHGASRRRIWVRRIYGPFVQRSSRSRAILLAISKLRSASIRAHRADLQRRGYRPLCACRSCPRAPADRGSPFNDRSLWVLGTVGRLQAVKAQPLLVQAFVQALKRQPALQQHARLVLVGDGPLRAECKALLDGSGLEDRVWLAGERADVPDVMRGLDCFALPSLAEGISNTILEAMSSALPVLATRVGGNADLVADGVSGVIVPPGDTDALADGIVHLASHPSKPRPWDRPGGDRWSSDSVSLPWSTRTKPSTTTC